MAAPIDFQSSWKKEKQRHALREAREHVLDKAKSKYEQRERKRDEAKQRGDDVWMLPSVNQRIEAEGERIKAKKHKKEKKSKKHKKHKKHKKQKASRSDTGENSSSDSEDGGEWVEKTDPKTKDLPSSPSSPAPPVKGPQLPPPESQLADWMKEDPFSFATYTRDDLRKHKKENKEMQDKWKDVLDKPGMSTRELNPFWKDGGKGLPPEKQESTKRVASVPGIGDRGLSWLKKAYQRACEEAEAKGRSLEDVMADRYGSMEKFQKMMTDAENAASRTDTRTERSQDGHDRYRPQDRERDVGRDRSSERDRHRDRDREGYKHGDSDRYNDRRDHRDTARNREDEESPSKRHRESASADKHKDSARYAKDSSKSSSSSGSGRLLSSFGKKFMRPSESLEEKEIRSRSDRGSSARDSDLPRWKNKAFIKPSEDSDSKVKPSSSRESAAIPAWKKPSQEPSKATDSADIDDERLDSASSESSDSSSESEEEERAPSLGKILTDKEMNELGAKLVKAEIMGDEEMAADIKSQLEASRKAKESHAQRMEKMKSQQKSNNDGEAEDESELILTRMDKSGQSWPVQQTTKSEERRGKKRRRKKVATHDVGGKRERYFADDDRYDLKEMVQREKMSSAEDQNSMFARLAGRSTEKTDGDYYTLDDMFVSRASKQMSQAEMEERDRAKAIAQQKRHNEQIDRCIHCFGNKDMPKHLIIAIGLKVYLCLPAKQSLTEGHCLIIPMQHCVSSTVIDEDVWSEIKIFCKGLTKMFEEQDQDTIFLETCMNPKTHRHMIMECIPVPKEEGGLAPIYFKKAIMESESEWAQNKKLIDTRQKDIRRSVPKGLPYFSVQFGLEGGFAHVIEDSHTFPHYFGKEIIGGMLDLEPRRWRNPPKQCFEDHRQKAVEFSKLWKPYDWTQKIDRE